MHRIHPADYRAVHQAAGILLNHLEPEMHSKQVLNIMIALIFLFVLSYCLGDAMAGGYYDPKPMPHYGGGGNRFNNNPSADALARANASLAMQTGAVRGGTASISGVQGGSFNVSGNGFGNTESSFYYPRQTPMAYAPSISTANPCVKGYSGGGSGAPFGFSFGLSTSDDECNARGDSIRFQELGLWQVGCERLLVDSDENQEALAKSGLTCADAKPMPVALPADVVTRQELGEKLDNLHRITEEK